MSKQVITIGYLKEFVSGILDVSIAYDNDAYCPTYKELTDGSICKYYVSNTNPTKTTNGIRIPTCTIDSNENDTYSDSQLVIQKDLQLLYQELQSITVTPDKTSGVSCCGESVGLTTTAYFKLVTKTTGGTSTAETSTNATVTATYSEDKDYTSIASGKLKFEKNSIAYQRGVTESVAARSSKVTASYTYSGITKTDDETVTQNGNSANAWSHISNTTTSITISPDGMTFGSGADSQTYSVTRYYNSYYERYDQCSALLDSRTDNNNAVVTPSKVDVTGDFTATINEVSVATNTGEYRTGTLTVTYDGHTASINLAQAASQAGTYYGDEYFMSERLGGQFNWDVILCSGGTAQYDAIHTVVYSYDVIEKDHDGSIISSTTKFKVHNYNVTNFAEWTIDIGTINKGYITVGENPGDDRVLKVTLSYQGERSYLTDTIDVEQEGGCSEEPAHPVINTLYVQNNLPGPFKLETSLSNQIETVGAGESNQNNIEAMVNMGGTITITVPKASILNGQSVCDSCHIAFATNCTSLDMTVASGNFRDDSGDVWWTPDLCFYNQDGSCGWPSATIYSGNYEIKVYINLGT